ncbi:6-pyruvoyl tetrahydropterin synthase-like protein [Halospina denitrificans]|uniref:6-carboxy-5,6,7,8-tetrahydropterin synthase n=1 Tax=Halospina denitrificans TaxID=332522 RepID=A0A4R7JQ95_9GAMM|nr:6-carboxytetrahydropterin synthase [Halospina denitrificans]TDT39343.1 6-pyruvoyl tetrahydropterin synthase-like protein [Halospina denitrificans]
MNRLFVDNLTVIDFAFLDPERGLVGESWIVDIELAGELNEAGMVFDFGHVKRTIKDEIDALVDHRLLVPRDHRGLSWTETGNLDWVTNGGWRISHAGPEESVIAVPGSHLQRERIETLLVTLLRQKLPANVHDIVVRLRPEVIEGALYHYTHGLRKHEGNCQRIAHGHRSRLEIYRNGARAPDLETYWAERWEDIYIATRDDEVGTFVEAGVEYTHYRYTANQGQFELILPSHRVETMDQDTTVEWIACYLRDETQKLEPDSRIIVKAFEGVNKGAYAGD